MTQQGTTHRVAEPVRVNFVKIESGSSDTIAKITINRPDVANAFNAEIITGLRDIALDLAKRPECRVVTLSGEGKHFSAGADLEWMKQSANLSLAENVQDASRLKDMFEAVASLPMPVIAKVRGAVMGGAVGLVALADIAVAAKTARFCLSEVKLGLLPAIILPYVARKIAPGQLRRHALSGRLFSADEALSYGLIERVVPDEDIDKTIVEEINLLLAGGPSAQSRLKLLLRETVADSLNQHQRTVDAIAAARVSSEGQAGLNAYFAKSTAPWSKRYDPSGHG